MDPGRREMIESKRSSNDRDRDATAPRYDRNTRVSKNKKSDGRSSVGQKAANYVSQDELSRQFVADEDKFVLKQSKKRADIRVRDGRAQPIDHLAFVLRYMDGSRDVFDDKDEDLVIEVQSPTALIEGLDVEQLRKLQDDIDNFLVLETDTANRQYWKALKVLCEAQELSKRSARDREDRILDVVSEDVDKFLKPQNWEKLEETEKLCKTRLNSTEMIDPDYWEQILRRVHVYKARWTVNRVFQTSSDTRAKLLKEQMDKTLKPFEGQIMTAASTDAGGPEKGQQQSSNEDASQVTKALYDREAARGISENEEVFTAEEAVPTHKKSQWTEKYGARKPRYFNRVQMGYEWNKYNQTHYDHDNPPPKVVQGYKFNIFYPDLVDVTKTPTFKIIRENGRRRGESHAAAGEADTCLIHFIAGPPYEDIAFRIVDREWDYSAKRERGFRSTFDKGILQLHFQFKKIFYRK